MYWLRSTFLDWTKKQGIELLRDDLRFIENILNKIPVELQKSIMSDYCKIWCQGMCLMDKSYQNQNLGRFKANEWLRKKVN